MLDFFDFVFDFAEQVLVTQTLLCVLHREVQRFKRDYLRLDLFLRLCTYICRLEPFFSCLHQLEQALCEEQLENVANKSELVWQELVHFKQTFKAD